MKAVDYMLSIPDVFIQVLESEGRKSSEDNNLTDDLGEEQDGD